MSETLHPDDQPMDWVGDWAGRRRRLSPDRIAVVDGDSGRRWSYADLDQRANRVANWLRTEAGLDHGDVVAFIAGNRVEALDLYLACGKAGFILAPLSQRLSTVELDGLLARIRPRALFVDPAFTAQADRLTLPDSVAQRVDLDGEQGLYADRILRGDASDANRPLALSETALYVHTGGSTGTPKICIVSHRQIVWNSVELVLAAPQGLAERRELVLFPLFHIGGWNTVTPILHAGGRVVLTAQFEAGRVLEIIGREGINHFGAVEAMLSMLAADPGFPDADLSSLRAITTAGAPCSRQAMEPFWQRGIPVMQSYGQTEAGPSNFQFGRLDAGWEDIRRHSGSIGTSFFHCDYRIVDLASGDPVPAGTAGELQLRSPHSFDGYLDDPERTRRVRAEGGWIRTGDLAREDEHGHVSIVGRADNMFVSGGENVAPEEVEAVLAAHPAVASVAVVGIPDPRWGEVGLAVVVARTEPPATEELDAWLAPRLGGFKRPRGYRFVDALPLTGAGKIDRNALKARFGNGERA
jgi:fatty-acyl-CoA synthase